jgi:hypothetical protein
MLRVLAQLRSIDERFGTLKPEHVLADLGQRIEGLGLAVKFSIRSGAFGDVLTEGEREMSKATQRQRRIRGSYEAAFGGADAPKTTPKVPTT